MLPREKGSQIATALQGGSLVEKPADVEIPEATARLLSAVAVPDQIGTGNVAATGAETLGVACPYCLIMLDDGAKARGSEVKVEDVAQVMVRATALAMVATRPDHETLRAYGEHIIPLLAD